MPRQKRFKKIKIKWPSFIDDIKDALAKKIPAVAAALMVLAVLFLAARIFIARSP